MVEQEHIGPYVLLDELGRGGMARVWRAYDPNLQRVVAVKEPLFDPTFPEDALGDMRRRFVAEGRAAARLNHHNIVQVHAADVWDGRAAIVMEYVDGSTLAALIARGPMAPQEALSVLDQLLEAVGYAHARGVVHRDIKPENVFVTTEGLVKLADFGIARVEDAGVTHVTKAGAVLGTPGYMSPEQVLGRPTSYRSDIFSVGVVAYEMLTGYNPFGAGTTGDSTTLMYRIAHEPAPDLPDSVGAGLAVDIRPAIMSALSKDPQARPASAAAFRAMLHGEDQVGATTRTYDPAASSDAWAKNPSDGTLRPQGHVGGRDGWMGDPSDGTLRPQGQLRDQDGHSGHVERTIDASSVPTLPLDQTPRQPAPARGWIPYAGMAAALVAALAALFISITASGGKVSQVSSAESTTEAEQTVHEKVGENEGEEAKEGDEPSEDDVVEEVVDEGAPEYYVSSRDGYVAIFSSDKATPYEVSDVDVSDLDADVATELDEHMSVGSIDEAREVIDELQAQAERRRTSTSSQIGNLVNGGHMDLGDDGLLYYASPVDGTDWDTRSIVRCNPDGSEKQTIYSGNKDTVNLYHISVIDGRVIFNREDKDKSTVVALNADGSAETTLDSCDHWSLCQVEDSSVYYLKEGRIRRCPLNGGSPTSFATVGEKTLWRVWNGRLLTFSEKDGTQVKVSNLDGSSTQTCYRASDGYTIKNAFPVDDQSFVVWECSGSEENTVVYVNPSRSIERELWHDVKGMQRLCSYEDGVVITARNSNDSWRLFSVTFGGSMGELDVTVSIPGEARYTSHMDDGRVYYGVLDTGHGNHASLHSVTMSGTSPRDIAG